MREIFFSSILDFPRKNLDSKVWDVSKDPPILRDEIKQQILFILNEALQENGYRYYDIVSSEHLTGSIGTTQYLPGTDLDVHLIPSPNISKEVFDNVQSILKGISGRKAGNSEHVINYFLQSERMQELRGDVLYLIDSDDWIIKPEAPPMDYDPYEKYSDVWKGTKNVLNDFMMEIGELQRDLTDVDLLNEYLSDLSPDELGAIEVKLEKKLQEIEEDLDVISEKFTDVHQKRKQSYLEESLNLQNYGEEWRQSLSWSPGNVSWKFLERYGMAALLANLRYLQKKDLPLEEQSEETRELLEEFNLMLERKPEEG